MEYTYFYFGNPKDYDSKNDYDFILRKEGDVDLPHIKKILLDSSIIDDSINMIDVKNIDPNITIFCYYNNMLNSHKSIDFNH